MCEEEPHEDRYDDPAESTSSTNYVIRHLDIKKHDIVNLYSADEERPRTTCLPFLQNISFTGPQGEIVRVKALFDEGAMISAMSTSIFQKIKHRLGNWGPSSKRLRMANGVIVPSLAVWKGEVTIAGIQAQGEFEVFDSAGGWNFLFGKPMLRSFKAIHNYETDQVRIMGIGGSKTLYNQSQATRPTVEETQDEEQVVQVEREGTETSDKEPSKPVQTAQNEDKKGREQHRRYKIKYSTYLAGHEAARRIGTKRCKGQTSGRRQRRHTVGSSELPTREVQSSSQESLQSPATDCSIPAEQEIPIGVLTEDGNMPKESLEAILNEIPANFLENDAAIFTRLTDPMNPRRVTFIIKKVQYGDNITADERGQAEALVASFADVFAGSLSEVLPVPGAKHTLNIPEGTTFNLRVHQRALTPPQLQFLHGRIDEMLAAGIIERAPPDLIKCAATTVLAKKAHEQGGLTLEELRHRVNAQCQQDGLPPAFALPEREVQEVGAPRQPEGPQKWRICQNFNEVNQHTIIAPMPQGDIRAKQQRLSGHKYVSVFDFASGFYAVEVPEESRPFTAFYVEGRGWFWYKRMPMGLTGAPSTFADMTATHLHDLIADGTMELFVDDGGCSANTFQEMMEKLTRIFQRCRERKLSLSPSKCRLFMTETTFAGATVGPQGVQPDLEKLTAIVNWEKPIDALNLESFLGLTGHFRDLVQGYAKREGPLRDLVKLAPLRTPYSKATYRRTLRDFKLAERWGDEHNKAFIDLKTALVSRPILQAPRYDGSPFVVTSDGCQEGLAAVLSQRVQMEKRPGKVVERLLPIAFASKRTSAAEHKYKPFLLEFAALKFGLDRFSDIVWGFPVEIETDCQALRDVLINDHLNAAHARWRDGILAHNIIDVRHVPGKLNVVADGLSRQWEGQPRDTNLQDGSNWTVSEDWEVVSGLTNDILMTTAETLEATVSLLERFTNEPVFTGVIKAIAQVESDAPLRDRRRAKHQASQYMIEDGKLWRLKGGTTVRARSRVECVTREEAKALATQQHANGGHWGRDAIKIALTDRIYSPKLDESIMTAIGNCAKCKNFGAAHLHSLLEPITRRHPFELLVGDYLTLPKAKGYHTLGVYLDTFSQHVWVFKYKTAGTAKTTIDSLSNIFRNFIPSETFMTDGGRHFDNNEVKDFCMKWACKRHVIAAYAPWINGLVEGTNKILLHVLKRLCAPELGEDDYNSTTWDKLPNSWPDHLDDAVTALNYRILPALKFSPKELLLGQVVNTPRTDLSNSTSTIRLTDTSVHMAYVAQQQLDGYDATVRHALKRKMVFDKRVLARSPREVLFSQGQLVQYFHSSLNTTLEAKRKILPRWSPPCRITERLRNSYKLETLEGAPMNGEFHARRLRAFIPRPGTQLAEQQERKERENTEERIAGQLENEDEEDTDEEDLEDEDEGETEQEGGEQEENRQQEKEI